MAKLRDDSAEPSNTAKTCKSAHAKLATSSDNNDQLRVAYHNPNSTHYLSASVSKPGKIKIKPGLENPDQTRSIFPMEEWIRNCKGDVGQALELEEPDVVCLVGMGQYKKGIQQRLPAWLDGYHKDPSIGLLKYIVEDRSANGVFTTSCPMAPSS